MKLYTNGEYMSNDISFEKKIKKSYYNNETLHKW